MKMQQKPFFFCLIAANNHIAKLWLTCNWGPAVVPRASLFLQILQYINTHLFHIYIHADCV